MNTVIRRLERAGMAMAGLFVILIMLIISYDGLSRYVLGAPLSWAFDVVTNYLMIGAAYFALSGTFQRGDHLRIDLLHSKMPPQLRAAVDIAGSLLGALLFAAIAYGAAMHAIEAFERKEFLPGVIMWPVWLSYVPIPIGAALLTLRLVHHSYMVARQGKDPFVESDTEGAFE